ncbi:putative kinesin-like protein [Plasmopara halstedii]
MKAEEKEAENIRVAVRCRPMNEHENREQAVSCFTCGSNGSAVLTNIENPTEQHEFGFDFVYGCDSKQELIFEDIGLPLLDRAFGGYNGTIFAYGQTGSGKSFSMTGVTGGLENLEGLIPRVNRAIFDRIAKDLVKNSNKRFLVECSYFEIHNEIVYDLLNSNGNNKKKKGGLEIKEHSVLGIYVKNLQERVVETQEEIVELIALGAQSRTVGYTQMNSESSRSHSIFTIKIHQKDAEDETKSVFAKINLVDLAGSERAASTGAQGDRLREGANINKSLSALGNVINALVEASRASKKVFIPYRNSKLTRVLQESLGGNSLCSMLATLSPASINFAETLSTLKYASRAKSIKVNAKKNEASSQISQLNNEIAALKQKLQEQMGATLGLDPQEKDKIVAMYEKQIQEMDRVRLQTWEDKAKLSKQHEVERKKRARERAQADQCIRDERTKKWRLLEEKGDLELMMRALRDVDDPNCVVADAGASLVVMQWLETAQKMKIMEDEAKDLRTLIYIFRDSLHKDADLWARRCGLIPDTTKATNNLICDHREDTTTASAAHMIASQMGSKLQNVNDECEKLHLLENRLVNDRSTLINTMTIELLRLKSLHAQMQAEKSSVKNISAEKMVSFAAQAANTAKEEEQQLEERERGLSITLALVRTQRSALVQSITRDRQRIFDFSSIIQYFVRFADQHSKSLQVVAARWDEVKITLLAFSKICEEIKSDKIKDCTVLECVGDGEVAALGLESWSLPDRCLTASSKSQDAKFARLNGVECWIADTQDATPSLVIDFELPRVFESISVRGGTVQFDRRPGFFTNTQNTTQGSEVASLPASTFILASMTGLQAAQARGQLEEVAGLNELTYKLLGYVMSWQDLLKTNVIPFKLFNRPPVRFLHDVISAVMHNTGFACNAISAKQRDYAQLSTKTERAEYLSSILNYVQAWYQCQPQSAENATGVSIAATTLNILAGKESVDTIRFLGYFALAAMDHVIQNMKAGNQERAAGSKIDTEAEVHKHQLDSFQNGWVSRIRVAISLTNNSDDWRILGEYVANTDATGVVSIALAVDKAQAEGNRVGRFLQLTCVQWHQYAALQCEVYGRRALESNLLAKRLERKASNARALVNQLRQTSLLVLQEAQASYDQAKVAESEKHAQLESYGEELAKLRLASAVWKDREREMQEQYACLNAKSKSANQRADQEKTRGDALQSELTQAFNRAGESKRQLDTLQAHMTEREDLLQTLLIQNGEQKRAHELLQQTKKQLEELVDKLCAQLSDKKHEQDTTQQKGQSCVAELNIELMSVRVQLDEQHRALSAAELRYNDQQAFGQQQYALLQQTRAALIRKEAEADAQANIRTVESKAAFKVLQNESDLVKQELKHALDHFAASEAELISWKRRAEAAETQLQAQCHAIGGAATDANGKRYTAELDAAGREYQRLLLEAQTNDLRRLAELEKLEAKLCSLKHELAESNEKAQKADHALFESLQRLKEFEETEEDLQLQLQIVTDERDSARQKEEQLFAETNEKDQEIERIRDGYVWVTDRMNLKEDELSELHDQLERYQESQVDKFRDEFATLYASATGAMDTVVWSDVMIVKLAEWIEVRKNLTDTLPKYVITPQVPDPESEHCTANPVKFFQTDTNVKAVCCDDETDYEDDFDEIDVNDKASQRK